MISGPRSRLAVVIVLLVSQVLLFVFECRSIHSRREERERRQTRSLSTQKRQWIAPILLAVLAVIIVCATFSNPNIPYQRNGTQCSEVDADIAGQGVRIAAFVQVCILIALSLLGSFHPSATGAKEVGGGLILTSLSLAIALNLQLSAGALTPADAILGVMILDGQSVALAIQFTSKETLTAITQVGVGVIAQFFGLGTSMAIIARFNAGGMPTDDCRCIRVFWWAWLSNCHNDRSPHEDSIIWVYMAFRFAGAVQASFHAIWNTRKFDSAEKQSRDHDDAEERLGGVLDGTTYPHFNYRGGAHYGEYPATVTFMYAVYGVIALTSLIAAESVFGNVGLTPSSGVDSPGQVIALVIAGFSAVRAGYLFWHLFRRQVGTATPGFHWPLHLHSSNLSDKSRYIRALLGEYDGDYLRLGTLLPIRGIRGLAEKYDCLAPVPDFAVERSCRLGNSVRDLQMSPSAAQNHLEEVYLVEHDAVPIHPYPLNRSRLRRLFDRLPITITFEYMDFEYLNGGETVFECIAATEVIQSTIVSFSVCRALLESYAAKQEVMNSFPADTSILVVYLVVGVETATDLSVRWTKGDSRAGITGVLNERNEQIGERSFVGTTKLFRYITREFAITKEGRVI